MKEKITLVVLVYLGLFIRLFLIKVYSVPFAYDMGRDLLWAKDIIYYLKPTLIGPAGSIWGVYFGPFWYYFLALPLYLYNGNPQSAVYATLASVISCVPLTYFLYRKILTKNLILTTSLILLFSSITIRLSTYAFHANVLPVLTLISIYFCYLSVTKNPTFIALAFLSTSLMFSADPAPAIVFSFVPPTVFLAFRLYKKSLTKTLFLSFLSFSIPLIPQLVFELRNNFIEVRSLIAYFAGDNPSLSGQLSIWERIPNRLQIFFDFYKNGFMGENIYLTLFSLPAVVLGCYTFYKNNKQDILKKLFLINLIVIAAFYFIFTFLITVEVKGWYLYGLSVPFAFLLAFALSSFKLKKVILLTTLGLFVFVNISSELKSEKIEIAKNDPANLRSQLKALELIYEDSKENYAVYVFTPSIYDHNYQYLFWWQGIVKKKGLPTDFAYLPNVPDYVRNKNIYFSKNGTQKTIYLIIESSGENEFYTKENWLNNFKDYNILWTRKINNSINVEKRQKE